MRTFKLIEEYYNSPKLGTIIREDGLGQLVSEQIEIFNLEEILKFPKHWEEFEEIDYTGTRFKCDNIEYYIKSKGFKEYTILFEDGSAQCTISNVHNHFIDGYYVKIETPKYVIGFDPASEDGDYCVMFKIKDGIVEVINQTKIEKQFEKYPIDDCILKEIKKWSNIQKPIFITEDGIELFRQDDDCWWVDIINYRIGKQPFVHEAMK